MAFRLSMLMILLAAAISLTFIAKLKPVGPGPWLFFSIWLILPYMVIATSLWRKQHRQQVSTRQVIFAATVISSGILALTDIIVWRPDPQGALAVLMIPLLQIMLWLIMNVTQRLR